MKQRVHWSVMAKLVLQITILVVVICVTLTVFAGIDTTRTMNATLKGTLEKRAADSAQLVTREIKGYINQVETIAQRPDIRSMDFNQQKPILIEEAKRIGFERFQVGDLNGDVISTTGDTANAADRPFYKEALNGISNISDVLFARIDKKMVIVVSAAIRDGSGNVVGVLSGVTDASKLNEIISEINLDYSGYGFIINQAGIKMAHKDYSLVENADNDIEKAAEDKSLQEFAEIQKKMAKGESGYTTYLENSSEKLLVYTPLLEGKWSLGIVQDYKEAHASADSLLLRIILVSCVFIAVGVVYAIFLSLRIKKPLKQIMSYANSLEKKDLTMSIPLNRHDDFGQVIASINHASQDLRNTLAEFKSEASSLNQSSEKTEEMVNEMDQNIHEVSEAVEIISSEMRKNAAQIDEINQKITMVKDKSGGLSDSSEETLQNVIQTKEKSLKVKEAILLRKEEVIQVYDDAKKQLQAAIEDAKGVSEISAMTDKILDIASQTNLLSLNASIEAARAGESGKGFAVVADEIGKLADESSNTVTLIQATVKQVLQSVEQLSTAADEVLETMGNEIDHLLSSIIDISGEYHNTQSSLETLFSGYSRSLSEVTAAISTITDGIRAITGTTGEVSETSGTIASSITDIQEKSHTILTLAENNKQSTKILSASADQFKVD